jgi:CHAT domain-containing protein
VWRKTRPFQLDAAKATEAALKSQPLEKIQFVHFALHGLSATKIPERTALLLASDKDSAEDILLQDREIRDLRLSADLVTLSACDTGIGRLQGQEGISSMVGSFLLAGARSVVASLWQVDDRSTSALMKRFYIRSTWRGCPFHQSQCIGCKLVLEQRSQNCRIGAQRPCL